eukprot:6180980-Pleurochrysis_carterae.AAC.1
MRGQARTRVRVRQGSGKEGENEEGGCTATDTHAIRGHQPKRPFSMPRSSNFGACASPRQLACSSTASAEWRRSSERDACGAREES